MRVLKFKVDKQRLKKGGDFSHIIAGSKGYLRASFDFSEDWGECKKVAAFYDSKMNEHAVAIINGECSVPDEVTDSNKFYVRVVGSGEDYRVKTGLFMVRQEVV